MRTKQEIQYFKMIFKQFSGKLKAYISIINIKDEIVE